MLHSEADDWRLATGRTTNLFASDWAAHLPGMSAKIEGKTVMVIGGAGSIGSATIDELCRLKPARLWVFDWNENELAELVRRMRGRTSTIHIPDMRLVPADFGGAVMPLFLASEGTPDLVFNFAAVKHVRSEKDAASLLHMMSVNLLAQARVMQHLANAGFSGRYFSVSTDKAANPSSLMGASKRAMEHVLFQSAAARALPGTVTSARFANVAYSNGSILKSYYGRLERREPLAAPINTRRYFVSPAEAGTLCAIAGLVAPAKTLVIPKLNPQEHLLLLEDIARQFLELRGYEAVIFDDENTAKEGCEQLIRERKWPLILTPLNTAGEKPYEEFLGKGESSVEFGCEALEAVKYLPCPEQEVDEILARLETVVADLNAGGSSLVDKDWFVQLIAKVEPDFARTHRDSALSLDNRL